MPAPEPLRWLLTAALAAATLFHLGRVALRPSRAVHPRDDHEHRVAELLHAVMGVAMVAMLWPFGRAVPLSAWLVVFAGSAGWFAGQASRAGRGWIVPFHFASTAAAMVWMSASMYAGPPPTSSANGAAPAAATSAMAANLTAEMPGMHHAAAGRPTWTAAAIGGYLVAAGLCRLLTGLRLGTLGDALNDKAPDRHGRCNDAPRNHALGDNGPLGDALSDEAPRRHARGGDGPGGGVNSALLGAPLGALRGAADDTPRCAAQWEALCHGVMGVSMGLAVLTLV
jgi:hypothetical protein